jgi:Pyridoxamine 5'-phosphate oxidase
VEAPSSRMSCDWLRSPAHEDQGGRVARWQDIVESEPDLAAQVRTVFESHKHKLIATLRRDGSPRLSGLEVEFKAGEVTFGMMPRSRKCADLRRDPRTEIHSMSVVPVGDEVSWPGDARISGRAREITDPDERRRFTHSPPEAYPLFVLDIERVVRIKVDGSPPHLLIQTWRPGHPLESTFAD